MSSPISRNFIPQTSTYNPQIRELSPSAIEQCKKVDRSPEAITKFYSKIGGKTLKLLMEKSEIHFSNYSFNITYFEGFIYSCLDENFNQTEETSQLLKFYMANFKKTNAKIIFGNANLNFSFIFDFGTLCHMICPNHLFETFRKEHPLTSSKINFNFLTQSHLFLNNCLDIKPKITEELILNII